MVIWTASRVLLMRALFRFIISILNSTVVILGATNAYALSGSILEFEGSRNFVESKDTGLLPKRDFASRPENSESQNMTHSAMSDQAFWGLIEGVPNDVTNPTRRLELLRSSLEKLPENELISFEITFRQKLNHAYSWDLWGAAYLIHGGCSDDGFQYFRSWLISRGQEVYQNALDNPDSLAELDVRPAGPGGNWEFEDLLYLTMDIFDKNGGEGDFFVIVESITGYGPSTPTGEGFLEKDDHLRQRYPKLWLRFGTSPLP